MKYILKELNIKLPRNRKELIETIIDDGSLVSIVGLLFISLIILG